MEDALLVGLLLGMILLAVGQIVLRNLFGAGFIWGDPLVRILVLWIGLAGAMVASRSDNHISIDIVSRYLSPGMKRWTGVFTHAFTCLVCGTMAWHSQVFVLMEMADGLPAFAWVPAWVCESIIPLSFSVICLRYFIFTLQGLLGRRSYSQ